MVHIFEVCAAILLAINFTTCHSKPAQVYDIFEKYRNDKVCTTTKCLKAAYEIKRAFNFSVDPCQDFYEFVCGNFLAESRIPEDKNSVEIFNVIGDLLNQNGRSLLEQGHDEEEDWELYKMPRSYYKQCMDEDQIERDGISGIRNILMTIDESLKWHELIPILLDMGFPANEYVVGVDVEVDDRQNVRRVIVLDQPNLGLNREYFLPNADAKLITAYRRYVRDVLVLIDGISKDEAHKRAMEIVKFEEKIALASKATEDRMNITELYNPTTLGEIQILEGHPGDWTNYVQSIISVGQLQVSGDERVNVKNPEFLQKVAPILKGTDDAIIKDYLFWRAKLFALKFLNKEALQIRLRFQRIQSGKKDAKPRWKQCAEMAGINGRISERVGLGLISGSMYVRKYFKPSARTKMELMVANIKRAFSGVLKELDWMDQPTKIEAKNKLEEMTYNIGYPDEVLDEEVMENIHEGLKVDQTTSFVHNALNVERFWIKKLLGRLRDPVNRKYFLDNPTHLLIAVANAFYSMSTNSMTFPAGFLNDLMFDEDHPEYLNYGAIGLVIGHEITHGFDSIGRQTDQTGKLRDWWSKQTEKNFANRTKCLINQYNSFEVEEVGLNVKGKSTLPENIADNVGYKLSEIAYDFWMQQNGVEASLPGLPFTPRQMVFVNHARHSCSKNRPENLRKKIITGFHSPFEFRVKGSIINSERFGKEFNCPLGSPMNPENKCIVW